MPETPPPASSGNQVPPAGKAELAAGEKAVGSMKGKPATWFDSSLTIRMRRGWRNAALVGLLVVVVVSTGFAAMQAPHPDMFRPIGLWDVSRVEWWAHPLERNAFKRQIVRGGLNAVFALPGGEHV